MGTSSIVARVAAAGFAAAALAGACGSDGGEAATTTTRGTAQGPVVVAKDLKFKPERISVRSGETVTWRFDDGNIPHNVIGGPLKSPTESKGEYSYTFDEAGTVDYVCTLHPQMKGKVKVS
jgi:plastocyanin